MSIPNNNTFSLQDVADYLDKSQEDNLVGLFDAAQDDEFDPNYEGNQDRLSNFRNYAGIWVGKLVQVVSKSVASDDEWMEESDTVRASVVGHDVKVVWKYESGIGWSSDFQIGGNLTLFGTTFDLDTYSGTPFQTTRVDTPSYSSATFYDIATGTTPMRFNKRSTNKPPSSTTGLIPPPYTGGDNTYYYAETTSSPSPAGNPGKDFWLRSPTVSVTANNRDIDYWVGFEGTQMGPGWSVYVEIIT